MTSLRGRTTHVPPAGGKESDKAQYYLDLLEAARCDAQWDEVPELLRKIRKHAPHRQCLVTTAEIEHAIYDELGKSTGPIPRPVATTYLASWVPALEKAKDQGNDYPEDVFQAEVCLAEVYMSFQQYDNVRASIPRDLRSYSIRGTSESSNEIGRWTHICIVKAATYKAQAYRFQQRVDEAYQSYQLILPYLGDLPSKIASDVQHYCNRETLLARSCLMVNRNIRNWSNGREGLLSPSTVPPGAILDSFQVYKRHWNLQLSSHVRKNKSDINFPPWLTYYDTLFVLVQRRIVQPMFDNKISLRRELKDIEANVDNRIMTLFTFPRADQPSLEMEIFVDQVMANWRSMCRLDWSEDEIGEGGRATLCRGILTILEKAAMKTFLSARVHRYLFIVHTALAEIDLASNMLDKYLDIVNKGHARVQKGGEDEAGLEDEYTALRTAAAGVEMLCKFGRRKEAEKSREIASTVECWVQKLVPVMETPGPTTTYSVRRESLAYGYYALGLSQSRWARLTHEKSSRYDLRSKAIRNLLEARGPRFGQHHNLEIAYSSAYVLAETLDLNNAMKMMRIALWPDLNELETNGIPTGNRTDPEALEYRILGQRHDITKCWHLLALLLSAKEDYDCAITACEAAFADYGGKPVLDGDTQALNSIKGLFLSEKKSILQVKMTHLTLISIIEGPERAVEYSVGLVGLYHALFDHGAKSRQNTEQATVTPAPTEKISRSFRASVLGLTKAQEQPVSPPPTANGTLRSKRGSMLGLPKELGSRPRKAEHTAQTTITEPSSLPSYGSPDGLRPPTISVTGEGGAVVTTDSSHHPNRHLSKKLQKRNSHRPVSQRGSRNSSSPRPATSDGGRNRPSSGIPHSPRGASRNGLEDSDIIGDPTPARPTTSDGIRRRLKLGLPRLDRGIEPSTDDDDSASTPVRRPPFPTESVSLRYKRNSRLNMEKIRSYLGPMSDLAPLDEPVSASSSDSDQYASDEVGVAISHDLPQTSFRLSKYPSDRSRSGRSHPTTQTRNNRSQEILTAGLRPQKIQERKPTLIVRPRPFTPFPEPTYTLEDQRRHELAMLVEIWLFVSTSYRDASKLSDAQEAVEEAWRAIGKLEASIAANEASSAENFSKPGYGGLKSSDELAADVHAEAAENHTETKHKTEAYEAALIKCPDHVAATVGLSKILLDEYEACPPEKARQSSALRFNPPKPTLGSIPKQRSKKKPEAELPVDEFLAKLAARDRAHGLLSALTESGRGWDCGEAWFELGRAFEQGGEATKAREAYDFVVDLDSKLPVREWEKCQ